MRKIITYFLAFLIILVGCSKNENNILTKELITGKYVEFSNIAGFKNEKNISLYHTLWILKIYASLELPIPNKNNINDWILSIDITDQKQRDQIGLTGLPLEESILIYLETLKILKLNIKESTLRDILIEIKEIEQKNESININNITLFSKLMQIYKLLGISPNNIDWSEIYFTILTSNIDNLSIYNKSQLQIYGIIKDVFEGESVHINSLNYKKINDAFILQSSLGSKSKSVVTFDEKLAKKTFNDFIVFPASFDPQIIYIMLTLNESVINSEDKKEFLKNFNALQINQKAWGDSSSIIDLDDTYFSLEILSYYKQLNDVNIESINKYLNDNLELLLMKESFGISEMSSLRTLALSYKVLGNDNPLEKIKNNLIDKIMKFEEEDINSIILDCILTISIATNADLFVFMPEYVKDTSREVINELEKKINKSFQDIYILYLYKIMLGELSPEEIEKLDQEINEFISVEGGISNLPEKQPAIADTYYYIRLFIYLGLEINDKTRNYLRLSLKDDEISRDIITSGILTSSLRMIEEGYDAYK